MSLSNRRFINICPLLLLLSSFLIFDGCKLFEDPMASITLHLFNAEECIGKNTQLRVYNLDTEENLYTSEPIELTDASMSIKCWKEPRMVRFPKNTPLQVWFATDFDGDRTFNSYNSGDRLYTQSLTLTEDVTLEVDYTLMEERIPYAAEGTSSDPYVLNLGEEHQGTVLAGKLSYYQVAVTPGNEYTLSIGDIGYVTDIIVYWCDTDIDTVTTIINDGGVDEDEVFTFTPSGATTYFKIYSISEPPYGGAEYIILVE